MKSRLGIMLITAVVILVLGAGICFLIWQGMLLVPSNVARLWALLVTAALPFATWAGWFFGHTEARGTLAGFDKAVDKVMGAASRAAGLTVGTARAMRQPAQAPPVVVLPDVEIVQRRLPSGGDVIEL